jgi:hypothetical protein
MRLDLGAWRVEVAVFLRADRRVAFVKAVGGARDGVAAFPVRLSGR